MKKSLIAVVVALLVSGGAAFAQTATFQKSKKLTDSEVPVAVMQAFQKDHADLQEKGFWKLHYTEKTVQGRTVFTPEFYSYNAKKDGEKITLNYASDGTLETTKESGAKK